MSIDIIQYIKENKANLDRVIAPKQIYDSIIENFQEDFQIAKTETNTVQLIFKNGVSYSGQVKKNGTIE